MSSRVKNFAPVGSLLKARAKKRKRAVPTAPGQRRPRKHDEAHLAAPIQ